MYRTTERFPRSEFSGLASQLHRPAAQISMTLAEGCGRNHSSEFAHVLGQARGHGVELEDTLLLSSDLQLLTTDCHDALQGQVVEVRRMLSGLIRVAARAPFDTLTDGIPQGELNGNGSLGAAAGSDRV